MDLRVCYFLIFFFCHANLVYDYRCQVIAKEDSFVSIVDRMGILLYHYDAFLQTVKLAFLQFKLVDADFFSYQAPCCQILEILMHIDEHEGESEGCCNSN